jgi:hypothetical protein
VGGTCTCSGHNEPGPGTLAGSSRPSSRDPTPSSPSDSLPSGAYYLSAVRVVPVPRADAPLQRVRTAGPAFLWEARGGHLLEVRPARERVVGNRPPSLQCPYRGRAGLAIAAVVKGRRVLAADSSACPARSEEALRERGRSATHIGQHTEPQMPGSPGRRSGLVSFVPVQPTGKRFQCELV